MPRPILVDKPFGLPIVLSSSSHLNCPKGKVVFASAPSASSAPALGASERDLQSRTLLTVLTLLTVFSADLRSLITLVPARPSRLKLVSIPSVRRDVCTRRKCPARARGFFSRRVASPTCKLRSTLTRKR